MINEIIIKILKDNKIWRYYQRNLWCGARSILLSMEIGTAMGLVIVAYDKVVIGTNVFIFQKICKVYDKQKTCWFAYIESKSKNILHQSYGYTIT